MRKSFVYLAVHFLECSYQTILFGYSDSAYNSNELESRRTQVFCSSVIRNNITHRAHYLKLKVKCLFLIPLCGAFNFFNKYKIFFININGTAILVLDDLICLEMARDNSDMIKSNENFLNNIITEHTYCCWILVFSEKQRR